MAVITYPIGLLYDDAGMILTAPVVTIQYVKDKNGNDVASHGAVMNNSGTAFPLSVDYDAEAHGEAWIRLNVTQAGRVITNWNAAPILYCARDSGKVIGAIDSAGHVRLDLAQAVPTSNAAETVGDALNAARANAFGKWITVGGVVTMYAADGVTVVHTFTLDSADNPMSRL